MAISKVQFKSSSSATPVVWMDTTDKTVNSASMLNGITALKNDGTTATGNIQSQGAQTIYPSTSDQTIASGKYLSGTQTIKGVLLTNLSAANIKKDVVVKVGDSVDDDRITSVTGTYEPAGVTLQSKTGVTPTESSQTITPDTGYDALSSVQINAISSTYVGSGITTRSSSDLTASGATVTVPAGYYSSAASKSVSTGSATGPSSLSGSSATVSTGTNTLTLTKTGVTTTPTVSAGYVSSATASTATVALTASVTTKAATTYHPSTSDQTIASGTYTTGTQTIKAVTVSGLSASSILSGTTVKIGDSTDDDCITSVAGSVTFQTIYSGSTAPSSSTGVNGDIYIQT